MERFEHIGVPAGDGGIVSDGGVKEEVHNARMDAGHVAGGDKDILAVHGKRSCMQPADGAKPLSDVRYAPDAVQVGEPFALVGVARNHHDLVCNLLQRLEEALDERPALEREEVLLPPAGTTCRPAYKDDRRPHETPSKVILP